MLKIYCSSCGTPHEYSLAKPNFCTKCGLSFNKNINNQIENNAHISKIEKDQIFHEDDNALSVPNLDKLNFEINLEKNFSEKISDLINQKSYDNEKLIDINKNINESFKSKNTLEDFAKEAGALRPKSVSRKVKNAKKTEI